MPQPPAKRARSELEKASSSAVAKETGSAAVGDTTQRSAQHLRIVTWNVASYRTASSALLKYVQKTDPDIICLQETKLQSNATPGPFLLSQYRSKTWFCSTARKGYAGTAILSKWLPQRIHRGIPGHPEHDAEGRCIVYEFPDLVLINVYVPNSGLGACERLSYRVEQWDCALRDYLQRLASSGRCIVLCGDMNVAMEDRDVYAVDVCQGSAGFTRQERESFRQTLHQAGLVDAFLALHGKDGSPRFTFWDYRDSVGGVRRNGWRIDLFCVSESMLDGDPNANATMEEPDTSSKRNVGAVAIKTKRVPSIWKVVDVRPRADVYGSDHCPVEMILERRNAPTEEERGPAVSAHVSPGSSKQMNQPDQTSHDMELSDFKTDMGHTLQQTNPTDEAPQGT
jgi:exodeoxyribonuclease III